MQELADRSEILTIHDVAEILRCSKTHVSNVINGKVAGVPKLTHLSMGRRKLIRRAWLDQWMEANKSQL
jgi:excisionase family DNA binding protein